MKLLILLRWVNCVTIPNGCCKIDIGEVFYLLYRCFKSMGWRANRVRSEGLRGLHSRETCDIPPALKKKGGYYKVSVVNSYITEGMKHYGYYCRLNGTINQT